MRALIALVLVLAALWSGYWYVGSTAKQEVLESWLEDRRGDGWAAEYSDFRVVGFPNRFDSRFTDLNLFDPLTGIGWKAPLFDILALSYQPNHIIAVFANNQTLSFPGEDVAVASDGMMASVVFEPDTKLAVDRISLETEEFALRSSIGWQTLAEKISLSTRQNPETEFAHDMVFDAQKVTPTRAFRFGLDPKGRLPSTIETLFLDMILGFNAPWDRVAIETGVPEVTFLTFNKLKIVWGTLGLETSGKLDVAPDGRISGELAVEIRNWREVLDLFVSAGTLDTTTADRIRTALTFLTSVSDDPTSLSTSLVLNGSSMALGPIPLGPAPRFIR